MAEVSNDLIRENEIRCWACREVCEVETIREGASFSDGTPRFGRSVVGRRRLSCRCDRERASGKIG